SGPSPRRPRTPSPGRRSPRWARSPGHVLRPTARCRARRRLAGRPRSRSPSTRRPLPGVPSSGSGRGRARSRRSGRTRRSHRGPLGGIAAGAGGPADAALSRAGGSRSSPSLRHGRHVAPSPVDRKATTSKLQHVGFRRRSVGMGDATELSDRHDADDLDAILSARTDPDEVIHAVGDNADAIFTWDYERSRQPLSKLYEKAKRSQWNARADLPWDTEVDQELLAATSG